MAFDREKLLGPLTRWLDTNFELVSLFGYPYTQAIEIMSRSMLLDFVDSLGWHYHIGGKLHEAPDDYVDAMAVAMSLTCVDADHPELVTVLERFRCMCAAEICYRDGIVTRKEGTAPQDATTMFLHATFSPVYSDEITKSVMNRLLGYSDDEAS